ncbi:hypothetical protein [Peribacillus simplex]|uniref:Lipoprotein n=1 Tax=Peribacillus simplex TaxID=1478 RepID=A0A9W4KWW8_9BACI|nr:hypothetical protein [Peribacillus simplex]MDR4927481.1 hypothetical protein [Peribacillus simplex]WHX92704.1 hypothetical protein QNH50_07595 [Peribacillus simplex]CAH0173122.1 hypothetical protein SRABI133_01236 [Peribacillus simplex]
MRKLILALTVLMAASGCGKKIPEPENSGVAMQEVSTLKAATTVSSIRNSDEDFRVKTFVKGNSVYVECYLKNYGFSESNPEQLATVSVFIDNQKKVDMKTAAFILKDVPNGMHKIKLEVLNGSGEKTGLQKEIEVHITSSI